MESALERALPLTERSYAAIRDMIIKTELSPGQRVTATALAESLGISRSPLKAALARLAQDKLIDVEGHSDTRVAALDEKYVRDVYGLRLVLECECARLSLEHLDDATLESLRARFVSLADQPVGAESDFVAVEGDLHRLLVDRCGNDILKRTIDGLRAHWDRIHNWLKKGMVAHQARHISEGVEILDALAARDYEGTEKALRAHLSGVGEQFVRALRDRPSA